MNRRCALVLAVLAAGCGAGKDQPESPKAANGVSLSTASAQYIGVAVVGSEGTALEVSLPARVAFRPEAVASLGAPVTGRIVAVSVRPGDFVKTGAPLITLQSADASAARASLEQARARAASAEDLLRRHNEMMARGVGVEAERVEADMHAHEARAELDRARQSSALLGAGERDQVVLRAPSAGIVATVKAAVGSVVSAGGDPLVEVADPTRLWIVADVAESDLKSVQRGQQARVRIPGADARLEGTVEGIGSRVDAETRRMPVYISIRGAPPGVTAGMHAEALLSRSTASGAITLPVAAVLIKKGNRVVYVQRADGSFESRSVRTGVSSGGRVEIVEGVKAGEKVVVKGALLLDGEAEQLL